MSISHICLIWSNVILYYGIILLCCIKKEIWKLLSAFLKYLEDITQCVDERKSETSDNFYL